MTTDGFTELDRVTARLREISRLDDVAAIRQLEEVRAEFDGLVAQTRARLALDLHVFGGHTFRDLAAKLGISSNLVSWWRTKFGPRYYVVIFPVGDGFLVDLVEPTQAAVRDRTSNGAVAVPSRFRLDLLTEQELAALDLAVWYRRCRDQAGFTVRAEGLHR